MEDNYKSTAFIITAVVIETNSVTELILDLQDMSYTSSAGLRVFLQAQKMMSKQGTMKVINIQSGVTEIFDMTGFLDILTIEQNDSP